MIVTERKVMNRLKKVIDPELGVNIVELGLIYKITIGKTIKVLMTLTSPGCPLAGVIKEMVEGAVGELGKVEVELTFDPPWVPDMMDERTKIELGLD